MVPLRWGHKVPNKKMTLKTTKMETLIFKTKCVIDTIPHGQSLPDNRGYELKISTNTHQQGWWKL